MSGENQVYVFKLSGPAKAWGNSTKKAIQEERLQTESYHFGAGTEALDNGKIIDIDKENKKVIEYLKNHQEVYKKLPMLFIAPGYSSKDSEKPTPLHSLAQFRLNSVAKRLLENPGSIVFVTGGNANPKGTPYNEAMEMKRHLMKVHKIPDFLIAIDPNAQNTVTNMRNAGRFMLAFGFAEGIIVTTLMQNLYISIGSRSGFDDRSKKLLGYVVGEISMKSLKTALFRPSKENLRRSNSKLDP